MAAGFELHGGEVPRVALGPSLVHPVATLCENQILETVEKEGGEGAVGGEINLYKRESPWAQGVLRAADFPSVLEIGAQYISVEFVYTELEGRFKSNFSTGLPVFRFFG